ncbi:polyhomeotic-like protein 3 isoform X6 [Macaca thibetana thibetana]|uniref:Polyhomeotic homolog 3 n=2 Tax=Macaca mulatta TaxID=9544 RepID=A0A5F7ZWX2_MACMU|nr:polyhomeotic-like protein 3 isoform X8 [Macaca fascicularis]XP_011916070.1 PREDICTED: polyhomeotic-like protein 3 isoform X11 [Cercocebus atys]XP_014987127.1 polyhomeotic-like protein 3 isoform X11 [Macaca mulatta]XP_050634217.1 polyhomeotic-like protein 3 isoform X6 [Macaca thibetana thibetana]
MAEAEFKDHSTAMDSEPNPGTSSVSTTTSSTTTTTITTSSSRMQQPQISVYSGSDRHAVQVIQQALHRPPSSAAQYLQQMYAAQQQHLMLHTAALQQQHLSSSQLQSLAAVQASLSSGRPSTSPTGSVTQQSSMSQTSVQNLTLRSQKLGVLSSSQNGPPKSTSQTQSLTICHNKTTVTSSKISQRDPSPESNKKGESPSLESRSTAVTRTSSIHQLIAPASYSPIQPHSLIKHQQIPLHSPPSKVSHHQLILQQQQQQIQPITLQNSTQDPPPSQHCIPLQNHGLPPAPSNAQSQHCSPIQSHPPPLTVSPNQSQSAQQSVVVSPPPPHSPSQSPTIIIHPQALIQPHPLVSSALQPGPNLQQSTANQVQPTAQLNLPSHLPLPASPVVHIGPVQQSALVSPGQQIVSPSHQQYSSLQSSPIPIASPPQMSTSPPAQIPPLPLQSMQSLQVQPEILSQGQVLVQNALVSEEELPAAEALVQLPFQTLPPPQTVAVNLQVQPPAPVDPPVGMHLNQCHLHKVFSLKVYQVEDVCEEEMPEESDECVRMDRTPPPPTLSPAAITVGRGEDLTSEHPLLEQVELPAVASVSASVIKSPSDPSHVSVPPPPLLLPAATTRSNSTSMHSSIPSIENKPPQAIVKPQILTHVIEGFVIQEGLEPFPVSRSSLLIEQPVKKRPLLDNQAINSVCVQPELQNNTKHADNSSDTEMEDMIAEETLEEMDSELLKCEFCGKMGYANEFLRSKRFCTMSCAKRYNVSCSKKFALSRWNRKPDNQSLGHRGRRPSGPDGAAREHMLRQLPITYPSAEEDLASHEDSVPSAMTTRLRRQSERERERELRDVRIRKMPENSDLLPVAQTEPSIWTVDDVWAFIHSLPGCQDIADEFRAQEIDGQALLLLKEDHLMSAMNIKLGPALKICARINSLKES